MRINFGELVIGDIAKGYLQRAIDKNWVSEGDNVREFEQRFADYFGYKHAIATSSGTDANICCCASLFDLGAKRGDEIITPALSFVATPNSILAAGFTPKFVDIELGTLNIDPSKIEAAISEKTKAIMIVHTMGKPCKLDEIKDIAETHNLALIEDCCEAHGAIYKNKVVGTIGDMATFSFYAAHLIVCGEGGMVVTNDDTLAMKVRSVKSHGRPTNSIYFDFQRFGLNAKMNDLEAALGIEGISNFHVTFYKRKNNLYTLLRLTEELSDCFYFIEEEHHEAVSPHAFPLVIKKSSSLDRNKLYNFLESRGIQCKTLFGSLPTQHKAFQFLGYKTGRFPVAEYVGEKGLHFGIHQYLSEDDLNYIADCLKEYTEKEKENESS